jgi:hypothetical protein
MANTRMTTGQFRTRFPDQWKVARSHEHTHSMVCF